MTQPASLRIVKPDDWHLHLRDGAPMGAVLPHTAQRFARAIAMPNLTPPVTTVEAAARYRERILAALPAGSRFEPLMTLYLTDSTPPGEIAKARSSGLVHAVKLYPAGATTPTDPAVDVFDREQAFIERVLAPTVARFPGLRVVFEHITTRDAVQFVLEAP